MALIQPIIVHPKNCNSVIIYYPHVVPNLKDWLGSAEECLSSFCQQYEILTLQDPKKTWLCHEMDPNDGIFSSNSSNG